MALFKSATRFVLFLSLLGFSSASLSATILAVVSPRNAPDVLSGAHQFLDANSEHTVILRTTDQFNGLEDAARDELVKRADLFFIGGVFGDSVSLVQGYLKPESNVTVPSFVAVHSDRRLVFASRIGNASMLANADLDELMQDPPADTNVTQWSLARLSKYSKYKDWLLSKTFWADRDTDNIDGLFRHLLSLSLSLIHI